MLWNFTEVRYLALDFKDQNYGSEIEMTGLTREQAAQAVAALFGTTARRTRESVTYDPWGEGRPASSLVRKKGSCKIRS